MAVVINGTTGVSGVDGSASTPAYQGTDSNTGITFPAADTVAVATGGSERVRVDSSGKVLVNATASHGSERLLINGDSSGAGDGYLTLKRGGNAINGDGIGVINFADARTSSVYARIQAVADGTPGTNDFPGALYFYTTADGSASPTERARITSGGYFKASDNGTYYNSTASYAEFNQSANNLGLLVRCSNTGLTNRVLYLEATRNTSNGSFSAIEYYNANAAEYRFRVYDSGQLESVGSYTNTTASAANMFISSNYSIARSTSSIKYKTQVENLDSKNADAILNFRPVWYRSLGQADNKNWSWYGLIAEEVAEIEPRLVHWGYSEEDYEVVETQENVQKERTVTGEDGVDTVETYTETETKRNKQLKADAQLKPEGVQYDRLTVLLLDIVKRQDKRIEALEAEVAALKAKE